MFCLSCSFTSVVQTPDVYCILSTLFQRLVCVLVSPNDQVAWLDSQSTDDMWPLNIRVTSIFQPVAFMTGGCVCSLLHREEEEEEERQAGSEEH